jgi:hypothetical protein
MLGGDQPWITKVGKHRQQAKKQPENKAEPDFLRGNTHYFALLLISFLAVL